MDLFSPHCIYVLAKWLLSLCIFKFMPMAMLWFSCCFLLNKLSIVLRPIHIALCAFTLF